QRHLVTHRHRPSDRLAGAALVGKEIELRLRADFRLPDHVGKNFDLGLAALLSAETEDRDPGDRDQDKNEEESAQHDYSSCTTVMCWPPVRSRRARASVSLNRGSRASSTRKKPSFVTRLNSSQLNIGRFQHGRRLLPCHAQNA